MWVIAISIAKWKLARNVCHHIVSSLKKDLKRWRFSKIMRTKLPLKIDWHIAFLSELTWVNRRCGDIHSVPYLFSFNDRIHDHSHFPLLKLHERALTLFGGMPDGNDDIKFTHTLNLRDLAISHAFTITLRPL